MTSRRLRVLLEKLPPESATWTALRNSMTEEDLAEQAEAAEPEKGRWSHSDQLLAALVDAVRRVEWVLTLAHSDSKGRKPPVPDPIRRPGVGKAKPEPKLSEAARDRLFQLIQGGAQ